MTRENTITAAILGELIPELQYAAPVLLERFERGEPLVGTTSPTDLGFDTSQLDPVLLEFFKALVPHVQMVLGWGVLTVLQTWRVQKRDARSQDEQVAALHVLINQNAKLRQILENIAEVLSRRDPVSASEVLESIAAATDDDRP